MSSFNRSLVVLASSVVLASALIGCGGSSDTGTGGTGGTTDTSPYDTSAKINAFLDGKTLTMSGTGIPADPEGYDENTNFGAATQCFNQVVIKPTSAAWNVDTTLGTLNGAASTGDTGMCDTTKPSTMVSYSSTAILITPMSEECFDITTTYVGFGQAGRGKIAADGSSVEMELYFSGQATGATCEDGIVGASGVTLMGKPFTGDAVQTYQITN